MHEVPEPNAGTRSVRIRVAAFAVSPPSRACVRISEIRQGRSHHTGRDGRRRGDR